MCKLYLLNKHVTHWVHCNRSISRNAPFFPHFSLSFFEKREGVGWVQTTITSFSYQFEDTSSSRLHWWNVPSHTLQCCVYCIWMDSVYLKWFVSDTHNTESLIYERQTIMWQQLYNLHIDGVVLSRHRVTGLGIIFRRKKKSQYIVTKFVTPMIYHVT